MSTTPLNLHLCFLISVGAPNQPILNKPKPFGTLCVPEILEDYHEKNT